MTATPRMLAVIAAGLAGLTLATGVLAYWPDAGTQPAPATTADPATTPTIRDDADTRYTRALRLDPQLAATLDREGLAPFRDYARELCADVANGTPGPWILDAAIDRGYTLDAAQTLIGAAMGVYCPQRLPLAGV